MNILVDAYFDKDNILLELDGLEMNEEEKEKVLHIASDIAELRTINLILERLEGKDQQLVLSQMNSGPADILVETLREKIENLEELLRTEMKIVENEILAEIKNLHS